MFAEDRAGKNLRITLDYMTSFHNNKGFWIEMIWHDNNRITKIFKKFE